MGAFVGPALLVILVSFNLILLVKPSKHQNMNGSELEERSHYHPNCVPIIGFPCIPEYTLPGVLPPAAFSYPRANVRMTTALTSLCAWMRMYLLHLLQTRVSSKVTNIQYSYLIIVLCLVRRSFL